MPTAEHARTMAAQYHAAAKTETEKQTHLVNLSINLAAGKGKNYCTFTLKEIADEHRNLIAKNLIQYLEAAGFSVERITGYNIGKYDYLIIDWGTP